MTATKKKNSNNHNNNDDHKNLPLVAEPILKKRHDFDEMRMNRAYEQQQQQRVVGGGKKKKNENSKTIVVKRPEAFVKEARARRNHLIRYRRVKKHGMRKRASDKKVFQTKKVPVRKTLNTSSSDEEEMSSDDDNDNDDNDNDKMEADEDEEKEEEATKKQQQSQTKTTTTTITYQSNSVGALFVFVIRIRNNYAVPREVHMALQRLRLRKVNDGVFVRYDRSNRKTLHLIEPWVIYGRPSKGVITDLIQRRGFGRHTNNTTTTTATTAFVPLSDNTIIEQALGEKYNIICIEDLIHEIDTVGEHFNVAIQFLAPFQLAFSATQFQRKTLRKEEIVGRDYGDKGEAINEYIQKML